jgi:hypothetical protein
MFKRGSIENELMNSMEKKLFSNQIEEQHRFNKLAKAIDYLDAAANIFSNSGLQKEADVITDVISNVSDWEDELTGGLADNKTPKDFDPKALEKGIKVELKEHAKNDPKKAAEIAMDHLMENPKYYDYLADMEEKMESEASVNLNVILAKRIIQKYASEESAPEESTTENPSGESLESIQKMFKDISSLDISEEDLKNIFETSGLGVMVNIFKKLYNFGKDIDDKGVLEAAKDVLKKINVADPEVREQLKKEFASRLATAVKVLNVAKMFA